MKAADDRTGDAEASGQNGPERTCAGCRRRRPARDLIRFQVCDGRLAIVERPGEGRSVYVCPDAECFGRASKRKAFGRSLKTDVVVPETLRDEFGRAVAAGREVS